MIDLHFPRVPDSLALSIRAFPYQRELEAFAGLGGTFRFPLEDKEWMPPHRIFFLLPKALRLERPVQNSILFGWRSILQAERSQFLGALVRSETSDDVERFVEFNQGRYVSGSLDGFRRIRAGTLENLPPSGRFEFRILFAPSVYLFSIWLHREDGDGLDQDLFFLLPPGPSPGAPISDFERMERIAFERFLNYLQEMIDLQENNAPELRGSSEGGVDIG